MKKALIILLSFFMAGCVTFGQPKKRMSVSDVREQTKQSLDSKITALTENTDPQLTDLLYWIDDPSGTPASNKIPWGTLLDDTKGNGDTAYVWSADKIYDQLALKADTTHADQHAPEGADPVRTWYDGGTLADDATPPVAAGYIYNCSGNSVTITDFYDSGDDDDGDFVDGDQIAVLMDETDVDIDFTTGTNIIGNADTDFVGTDAQPRLVVFTFLNGVWYAENLNDGFSDALTQDISVDRWHHMVVPRANISPDGTNCENWALLAAGNSAYYSFATRCDDDAVGHLYIAIPMPENWDGADAVDELKVIVHWGVTAGDPTDTKTVIWDMQIASASNGDAMGTDSTWVAASAITKTFVAADAQYDIYSTELSADTAISGAGGDLLFIDLWRDTAADDYADYADVRTVDVYFKIDDLQAMD